MDLEFLARAFLAAVRASQIAPPMRLFVRP